MIIGIFGQPGSGRSTFAHLLKDALAEHTYTYKVVNKFDNYASNDNFIIEHGEFYNEALAIKKLGGYNIFAYKEEYPPSLSGNMGMVTQWLIKDPDNCFDKYFNYLVKMDHPRIMKIHAATVALTIHFKTLLPVRKLF